jgi:hypothetical protein
MSWKEAPPISATAPAWSHFLNALVMPATPIELTYEFRLIGAIQSNADQIDGTWMILKNGTVVSKKCSGSAYGLNQPAGGSNYFKLVCTDPSLPSPCDVSYQWAFVGFITDRYDY